MINVLSVFDGMSAGRVAFAKAGISINNYYRAEIDKYANQVAYANYPDDINFGDVTTWESWELDWGSIDYFIGGSPCQGFSFAGKQLAFDDSRSKLFFTYVAILRHIQKHNPNVKFLLENVRMKKEHLNVITDYLGVQPMLINSALVSAQNRQRYYWANFKITQPSDRGILLRDILDYTLDPTYNLSPDAVSRFTPCARTPLGQIGTTAHVGKIGSRDRVYATDGKMPTLLANSYKQPPQYLLRPCARIKDGDVRHIATATDIKGMDCVKQVHGLDGKSPTLTTIGGGHREPKVIVTSSLYRKVTPLECERLQTFPDNYSACVSNTQRYKMLGNSWTVDVIAHILRGSNV